MDVQKLVVPLSAGGYATLTFPEPVTPERVRMLEEATALMLEALRDGALARQAEQAGAIEHDSWAVHA